MKSLASVFPFYQGFHGERGGSKNCYGANGAHVYVKVSQWMLPAVWELGTWLIFKLENLIVSKSHV